MNPINSNGTSNHNHNGTHLGETRRGATILVVDDHECLSDLVSHVLREAGYHVLTAVGGEHAQALARGTPRLDLLVTDIEMPRLRGDELANWLATVHPDAKVVFVSSSWRRAGTRASHFVAKPFHISELLTKVRAALDGEGTPAIA